MSKNQNLEDVGTINTATLEKFTVVSVVLFQLEHWNATHAFSKFFVSAAGGTQNVIAGHLSRKLDLPYELLQGMVATLDLYATDPDEIEYQLDVKGIIDFIIDEINGGKMPPLKLVLE